MIDRELRLARIAGVATVLLAYAGIGWKLMQTRQLSAEPRRPAPQLMVILFPEGRSAAASSLMKSAARTEPEPDSASAKHEAPAGKAMTQSNLDSAQGANAAVRPQRPQAAGAMRARQRRNQPSGSGAARDGSPEAAIRSDHGAGRPDAPVVPGIAPRVRDDVVVSRLDYDGSPPKPEYPARALRDRQQGRVLVRVLIGTNGAVLRAEVRDSSGYELLDAAAVRAALRTKFRPYLRDGVAYSASADLPYNFVVKP